MHATLPLLEITDFPLIKRSKLETLQVNLGYKCNQQCLHCHVNASPQRKEVMDSETIDTIISFLETSKVDKLDLTGGAPELNPYFRKLVRSARQLGVHVIDRCNLTILEEPGFEDLAEFLAEQRVEVIASLPCYLEDNVDKQRGNGVFAASISGLQQLNKSGYGKLDTGLELNLVFNPQGPELPPPQVSLEQDYKKNLEERFSIVFNHLFTLANMPIKRFGSTLISKGQFEDYMSLLRSSHNTNNLRSVMCKTMISVDWQGYVYDCDFNQMLELPLGVTNKPRIHIDELVTTDLEGGSICVKDHCFGCTAGQGSSCGGALV